MCGLFSCLSVGKLTIRRQWGDAKDVWHGGQKSPDNRPWWVPPCAWVCLFAVFLRILLCKLFVWRVCVCVCVCVLFLSVIVATKYPHKELIFIKSLNLITVNVLCQEMTCFTFKSYLTSKKGQKWPIWEG